MRVASVSYTHLDVYKRQALSLMLIGLGLVFRDGVAVVLGLAMAALAIGVTAGVTLMAWAWGSKWLLGLFSM